MDELMFIVQVKGSDDLGHVALAKDEQGGFLVVHDSTHILSRLWCTR